MTTSSSAVSLSLPSSTAADRDPKDSPDLPESGGDPSTSSFSFIGGTAEGGVASAGESPQDRGKSPFSFIAGSGGSQTPGGSTAAEEDEAAREDGRDGSVRDRASPFSFLDQITSRSATFDSESGAGGETSSVTRTRSETLNSISSDREAVPKHTSAAELPHTPQDTTEKLLPLTNIADSSDSASARHPQMTPPKNSPVPPPLPTAAILSPSPPPSGTGHAVAPGPVITTSRPIKATSPQKAVGKQLPPSGAKKRKKRTAFRPGQEGAELLLTAPGEGLVDIDAVSVSSQNSSFDGGKDSVSISSSSSELHKLVADELIQTDELETGSTKSATSQSLPSLQPDSSPVVKKTAERKPPRDQDHHSTPTTSEDPSRRLPKLEVLTPPGLSPKKGLAVSGQSTVEAKGQLVDVSAEKGTPSSPASQTSRPAQDGGRGGEREERERVETVASPDRELAEVCTEPTDAGGSSKDREGGEKEEEEMAEEQGPDYEVELTPTDWLAALLKSSDSSIGGVR